jgi:ribonuclease HII
MKSDIAQSMNHLEQMLFEKGYRAVCGVDEVGRGPLAGPVVAAAVIMPPETLIEGLADSKRLTPLQRERIFEEIADMSLVCSVGVIDHESIDRMNILRASLMAMRKAVMDLRQAPDIILVDGNYPIPNVDQPQFTVVGGDRQCQSISAASIVAKITRDRIMDRYQAMFPSFSFSKHKGYPTPEHLEELREYGPTDIHRRSFKPVADLINTYALL